MGGRVSADTPLVPAYKPDVMGCPGNLDDFMEHANSVAASCQLHWRHFATCQTGKTGKKMCRMGQPQPLRQEATGPVQVR